MSFVVETKKDFDRLVDQYPGRILFCDRTRIQDTLQGKCIDQTSHLHEVRSYEKVIPEEYMGVLEPAIKEDKKKNRQAKSEVNGSIRNWQVVISDLPCNCVHCIGLSTLDAEIDDRVIKVKVTQESDLEKTELCKYSK
jgi:hypothetical protein